MYSVSTLANRWCPFSVGLLLKSLIALVWVRPISQVSLVAISLNGLCFL